MNNAVKILNRKQAIPIMYAMKIIIKIAEFSVIVFKTVPA